MSKSGNKDVAGVELKKLRNKKLTSTEFMQVWFHYDKDKSGYLEYVEFSQFMKDLFLKKDCTDITPEQVEKYTAEVIHLMDTYDENRDGRFEMNELAKALKIEENYLNKIINKKSIKDKHIQSVLKHYDSNCDQILQGIELKAFVGDLVRSCPDLPYNFAMIEQACNYIQEMSGDNNLNIESIKLILSLDNRQQLHRKLSEQAK
ncbi:hypothetical protein ACHWQZ_G009644 [Mnemiopsis leidyi]